MPTSAARATNQVFIKRGDTGFRVVPGTCPTRRSNQVLFRNDARATVEVRDLNPAAFFPTALTLEHGQDGPVDVLPEAPFGLYEYTVQEVLAERHDGFFAVGNSRPNMIVDP